jgi:hypothetical protein
LSTKRVLIGIIGADSLAGILAATILTPAMAVTTEEVWVGHQVVFGKTSVPFMGEKETRSDSYLLARVKRAGGVIELEQLACKVSFKEIAGVKIDIPEEALLKLPKARIHFVPEDDLLRAKPWHVGWHKQDIDKDGAPGLSVLVDASICSGKLHVASVTRSAAVAKTTDYGLMGKISVEVKQKVPRSTKQGRLSIAACPMTPPARACSKGLGPSRLRSPAWVQTSRYR